ncbi:MAG: type II secretion system protein [Pseudomonadota bacterium]
MKMLTPKIKGFTLLEMLLVLAIASGIIVMMLNFSQVKMDQMRRERTAIQMQGILNAAASYYVVNSTWPASGLTTLQSGGFLPAGTYKSGWGDTISGSINSANGYVVSVNFSHGSATVNAANASIVAGMLPLGSVSGTIASGTINIPGQNLNNAMAVNYGAVYYSGACVPAPTCPSGMKPTIMVIPVSVTGVLTGSNTMTCSSTTDPTSCTMIETASLNSFTAFYRGTSLTNDLPVAGPAPAPLDCEITPVGSVASNTVPCNFGANAYAANTSYWRVCIAVANSNGLIYPAASDAQAYNEGRVMGSVLAITRCQPISGDLPAGSSTINTNPVWTPNKSWQP